MGCTRGGRECDVMGFCALCSICKLAGPRAKGGMVLYGHYFWHARRPSCRGGRLLQCKLALLPVPTMSGFNSSSEITYHDILAAGLAKSDIH